MTRTTIAPTIECPCDRSSIVSVFQYNERPDGEAPFDLRGDDYVRWFDQCTACRHWFGRHNLDLANLYSGEYVSATYGDGLARAFDRIVSLPAGASDNAGRARRVDEFAANLLGQGSTRKLLDVGSGTGVFPYAMKQRGWNCTALDPDPRACEHLRETVGVSVVEGDLMTLDLSSEGVFDLITFNKVLEHVENPVEMLRAAIRHLDPQGILYVEVPDGDTAAAAGQGREEFFIEHSHAFSAPSLAATVERSGLTCLELRRIVDPSGKFTIYCFAAMAA